MECSVNELSLPIRFLLDERTKQDEKWGEQNHPPLYWNAILVEEIGELSAAIIEGREYHDELVQVGAVALAWLEARIRGGTA